MKLKMKIRCDAPARRNLEDFCLVPSRRRGIVYGPVRESGLLVRCFAGGSKIIRARRQVLKRVLTVRTGEQAIGFRPLPPPVTDLHSTETDIDREEWRAFGIRYAPL